MYIIKFKRFIVLRVILMVRLFIARENQMKMIIISIIIIRAKMIIKKIINSSNNKELDPILVLIFRLNKSHKPQTAKAEISITQ